MAKSYKLKGDNYIDSSCVIHNRFNLKDILNYSLQERKIGTWIDGKPLYRKTVVIQNTAFVNGNNQFAHNIDNFKQCIKAELAKGGSNIFPYFNTSGNSFTSTSISNVDSSNITIRCINDTWGGRKCLVCHFILYKNYRLIII